MVDLTASAGFLKRSALWIALGIVALILIITFYMYRSAIQQAFFPPKPLPATVAFGLLPRFDFSAGFKPAGNLVYTLQTVSGGLPSLPTTAKVFAVGENKISFSSPDLVLKKAASLGFDAPPQVVGGKMTFVDRNNRALTVDILTGDMVLTSNYLNNPDILTTRPQSLEQAKELAQNFMNGAGLDSTDYPQTITQIKYWRLDGGSLTEANSLSGSNLVGVNYSFANLDKLPIFTTDKNDNLVSALVSDRTVVDAKYQPLNINKGLFATYPLKSVSQAYEELKSGNAVFNIPISDNSFTITSVGLGYLAQSQGNYLIPVYAFNMSSGLSAFVQAVDNNWIQR